MKHVRGRGKKAEVFSPKTSYKLGLGVERGEQVGFCIKICQIKILRRPEIPRKQICDIMERNLAQFENKLVFPGTWNPFSFFNLYIFLMIMWCFLIIHKIFLIDYDHYLFAVIIRHFSWSWEHQLHLWVKNPELKKLL